MNVPMIRTLVLKDWHFLRWPIFGYLIAGAVALVLIGSGGEASFYAGSILLITAVISVGIHLTMLTVVDERTQQTLPFVMSLPISPSDYTIAKMLANVLIYVLPWSAMLIGSLAVIMLGHDLPRGLVPFAVIVMTDLFFGYVLMLATAVVSESMGWTILAMILGNFSLQATMYVASNAPAIAGTMHGARVVWSLASVATIVAEIIAIVALIALTFFVQSRKTDFV